MIISQSFQPRVEIFPTEGSDSILFDGRNGNGLFSYNFSQSLSVSGGTFSFSFKDTASIMDSLNLLDVVHIYEYDRLVFIGVITDISFSASAQGSGVQRAVNVSGKSADYLFEMLRVSLDISALAIAGSAANSNIKNISFITELNKQGTKAVDISDGLNTAFEDFKDAIVKYKGTSSIKILDMLKSIYGSTTFRDISECGSIKFKYPLSSNLYKDKTIKFLDLIRDLLPAPVYEIFSAIGENDKPKLIIRECPFDSSDWTALNAYHISPDVIRDYSLSRNCEEVYTDFITYVEGSNLSPDFYRKIYATENGNVKAYQAKEVIRKKEIYGYRPLEVTFSGFYSGGNDNDTTTINDTLNSNMSAMNKRLADWFGSLDEMYSGSVTIVNTDVEKAKIGERISVGGIEFYVTGERHSWQCTGSAIISFTVDRGGQYSNGKFTPYEGMSKFLGEWE